MAGPQFGSVGTSSGGGNGTACTVPVPPGVAAGHIILVPLYIETTQAVTVPDSSWAEAPNSPAVVTGTQAHDLHVYWRRATGADSGSYGFTIAAGLSWRMGVALRFTGCVSHGSPWEATTSAIKTTATDGTTPAVSATTTGLERLWVWFGSFFNGDTSCTPPTGFTERADISGGVGLSVATKDQPQVGSSGSVTGTFVGSSGTAAFLGALKPAAGAFLSVF